MFDDRRGHTTIIFGTISQIQSLCDHGRVEMFVITQLLHLVSTDDGEEIVLKSRKKSRERGGESELGSKERRRKGQTLSKNLWTAW
jgi:hypothetical protein